MEGSRTATKIKMMKTKILHLTQVHTGGVERYLRLYLQASNKGQFEHIIVGPEDFKSESYNDQWADFCTINISNSMNPIKIIKSAREFRQVIGKISPDLVYLHSTFAGLIGRIALIGKRTKIAYNPHGWSFKMETSRIKRLLYSLAERFLAFKTDLLVMISQSEYDGARQLGISEKKMTLVYNGIFVNQNLTTLPTRSELNLPEESYIIGMLGRLAPQKDPLFFLSFAKEVLKEFPKTFFVIVGDGEMKTEVEEYIAKEGLTGHILLTGWTDSPEAYLNNFDQAVLFSRWEGLCLAITEYMLYRKPVLATDIGGINDMIRDQVTGLTIKPGNLSEAVRKSKQLREDVDSCDKYVKNASKMLEDQFDVLKNTQKLEERFAALMAKRDDYSR